MQIGDMVQFNGYSSMLAYSPPELEKGDLAVIIACEGEDAWRVARVPSTGLQPQTELVFTEEISKVRIIA